MRTAFLASFALFASVATAEKLLSDGIAKFPGQAALLMKFRDYARNKNKNF